MLMLQYRDYCWNFEWIFWCYCIVVKCRFRLNVLMSHSIKNRTNIECFMKLILHFCMIFFFDSIMLWLYLQKKFLRFLQFEILILFSIRVSATFAIWVFATFAIWDFDFIFNKTSISHVHWHQSTRRLTLIDHQSININFTRSLTLINVNQLTSKNHQF